MKLVETTILSSTSHSVSLRVEHCQSLFNLSPLEACADLEVLTFAGCPLVSELSPLSNCRQLVNLNMSMCPLVSDLGPLTQLSRLSKLYLNGCTRITPKPFQQLKHMKGLQYTMHAI